MACDIMFFEHKPSDRCDDQRHQDALARRAQGAPPWHALETRADDDRHFLDGKPVHCGDVLELQDIEWNADDYGEYTLRGVSGHLVRYELAWPGKHVVLHVRLGGHEYVMRDARWMRFRWPTQ